MALLVLLFNSCNKEDDKQDKPDDEVSISQDAELILQTDWVNTIQAVDTTDYTFTFSDEILNTNEITEGDIIVSSEGEGYLRRIWKVTVSGGEVTVETEFASLDEVIENGGFSIEEQLTQNKIKEVYYYKERVRVDTSYAKSTEEQDINYEINTYLDPGENIHLTGTFYMEPTLTMEYNIHWFELDYLKFGAGVEEQLEVAADVNVEGISDVHEVTLAGICFNSIIVQIGAVPVVLTPVIELNAGIEYDVETNIWSEVNQQLSYENGIEYNGEWTTYSELNKSFSYTPPQLDATAEAKVYLKPEFLLKIYGTISPKLYGELYDRLVADINVMPWWSMYAGAEFGAGIKVGILSRELFDKEWVFDDMTYEVLVIDAGTVENQVPEIPIIVGPGDNAQDQPTSLTLQWNCQDPDGDPLTYDIYFDQNNPPSLVAEDIENTEYQVSGLNYNTTYYWQIKAYDNYENISESPVWAFTTTDGSGGNTSPSAFFTVSPLSGSTSTNFLFDASGSSDNEDPTSQLQVRWDFDGDGYWDSNWSTDKTEYHQYSIEGTFTAKVEVQDTEGLTDYYTRSITVDNGGGGTVDLEWVDVAGGTFQMGCTSEQYSCNDDEFPVHTVTLNSFKISKYEITNAQYVEFLNDINCNSNGNYNDDEFGFVVYIDMDDIDCQVDYSGGQFVVENGKENYPVIEVSWYGANAFAQWVGGRLPTEAEWEFAARGGNQSQGYIYSGSDNLGEVGWYSDNSGGNTHPVGTKQPNELGLYDMSGNVCEWCSDWYDSGYYNNSPQHNPQGPSSGSVRVFRGGSWGNFARRCREANRYSFSPGYSVSSLGFRLSRDE
jgi:formylglycine-generating enzyme required for sulfatase activity